MEDIRTCALEGCEEPAKQKFCCRAHAQKFHNSARDYAQFAEKARAYRRAQMNADPEAVRKKARERYAENREYMAARQAAYYHANKDRYKAINRRSYEKNPFRSLLAAAAIRANKRGLPFELTWEWARSVWTGNCSITNIPFVVGDGAGPAPFSPTIDRIDASKGYTPDNSRFILMGVNALKGRGTDADMYVIAEAIVAAKSSH